MAPPARAYIASLREGDVVDDGVGAGGADTGGTGPILIQSESLPHPPSHIMVGAGTITADADTTDHLPAAGIKPKTAAEHVDAADLLADHSVLWRSVGFRIALVGGCGIDGIALLKAEE